MDLRPETLPAVPALAPCAPALIPCLPMPWLQVKGVPAYAVHMTWTYKVRPDSKWALSPSNMDARGPAFSVAPRPAAGLPCGCIINCHPCRPLQIPLCAFAVTPRQAGTPARYGSVDGGPTRVLSGQLCHRGPVWRARGGRRAAAVFQCPWCVLLSQQQLLQLAPYTSSSNTCITRSCAALHTAAAAVLLTTMPGCPRASVATARHWTPGYTPSRAAAAAAL